MTDRGASGGFEAESERFRSIFAQAPTGLAVTDLKGDLVQVNLAFRALTGHRESELVSSPLTRLVHPGDVADLQLHNDQLLAGTSQDYSRELRFRHAAGHDITVLVHTVPVRDGTGSISSLVSHVRDVTQERQFEQRLAYLADHDELTGLLNRRRFTAEVHAHVERCRRYGVSGAVLMLDLDNFKQVNDTFGHIAGDRLIQNVAQLLRHTLRGTDVVARIGGDEFAVLLPRADAADARAVGEKIRRALRAATNLHPGDPRRAVTVSVGVAVLTDSTATADDILMDADLSVYDAKESGRDRVASWSRHHGSARPARTPLVWASRVEQALARDGFQLWAQPMLDIATGSLRRYELLLRMTQEDGTVVAPAAFIGVAERSGLIVEVDSWVIRRAVAMLAELDPQHAGTVDLSVNISGVSMSHRAVGDLIERELSLASVDPARLGFEMTETAAVQRLQSAQEFASRVHALGCPVALDDFGAGLRSFFYLKHLPFDVVKIDGEFVTGCLSNEADRLVLRALVSVARGLGKQTVAEFVEDEPTLHFLREEGVEFAQGYHIGRPAPLPTFLSGR